VRLATVNHCIVQIAVAHLYVDMQIGLVGETGVVQAAVFKVTVLKVDFASG